MQNENNSDVEDIPTNTDNVNNDDSIVNFDTSPVNEINTSDQIHDKTFFCHICYEHVNCNDPLSYISLENCSHTFCMSCFHGFLRVNFQEAKVELKCFFPISTTNNNSLSQVCNSTISEDDIIKICLIENDVELFAKYERFKRLKENFNARECPYCYSIDIGDKENPIMMCSQCNKGYCFFHSNAHSIEQSCKSYLESCAQEEQLSLEYIHEETKSCPTCSMRISKIEGCNHMKCPSCQQSFCWICGSKIDNGAFPAHFQWWNLNKCSNLQMNNDPTPSAYAFFCARTMAIVQIIFFGPLVIVSIIIHILTCCPCFVFSIIHGEEDTYSLRIQRIIGNLLSIYGFIYMIILVIIPLGVIFGSIALSGILLAFCITYPIYAVRRIFQRKFPWPDEFSTFCIRICCCTRSISDINDNENSRDNKDVDRIDDQSPKDSPNDYIVLDINEICQNIDVNATDPPDLKDSMIDTNPTNLPINENV